LGAVAPDRRLGRRAAGRARLRGASREIAPAADRFARAGRARLAGARGIPVTGSRPLLFAIAVLALATARSHAQAVLPTDFSDNLVVGGLSTPTALAFLPDGRALVTEQLTGKIRL